MEDVARISWLTALHHLGVHRLRGGLLGAGEHLRGGHEPLLVEGSRHIRCVDVFFILYGVVHQLVGALAEVYGLVLL